ncbi:MAG TPA: cell envelope integrity protein TolA [Burkholderiaceae bacterium]
MHAATAPYSIPHTEGRLPSFVLALAMHAALLAFLWVGIRWQSQTPIAVEAEVWDMQTREAAPKIEPEPEPKPVIEDKPVVREPEPEPVAKPDIALEQIKKKKEIEKQLAEEKRLKDLEKKKLAEEKLKKELAEKKALDKLREDTLRRSLAVAGSGAPNSTSDSAKSTGRRGEADYVAKIVTKIKSNITYGGSTDMPGNPQAEYRITQLPTGEIISSKRIRSSGNAAYDAAVEKAIAKSSPLPRKKDGTVEREIVATFNLKEE